MSTPVSAEERASALDSEVNRARGEVARLEREVAAAREKASAARLAADAAAASGADAEAEQLAAELATARTSLTAWAAAHQRVGAERARELQQAELADVERRVAELEDDHARAFSEVKPRLDAAVEHIHATVKLERDLHAVRAQAANLRANLAGEQAPHVRSAGGRLEALLDRNRVLRDLLAEHPRLVGL
jgi:chromosome segregation ATPase